MSWDVSILLRFAGNDARRPLVALLRQLVRLGQIAEPEVRWVADQPDGRQKRGGRSEITGASALDEELWSRPEVATEQAIVWACFRLTSGRGVSTIVRPPRGDEPSKGPSARLSFVADDTMDMTGRCWNGEIYPVARVLAALVEWEADMRELFTLLCVPGIVDHAAMSLASSWVAPEECSMIYYPDAREVMVDVVRWSSSRQSPESLSAESGQQALDLGALDVSALVELSMREHGLRVDGLRRELARRNPPLDGVGMTRILGRAGSIAHRRIGDGLALMGNPLSTLLPAYQVLAETLVSFLADGSNLSY